jgi:hypothetical protein
MVAMSEEPTDKQLAFLKRLKYAGPSPKTKQEASVLIDASKAKQTKAKEAGKEFTGLTSSQAEKALEKDRRAWRKDRRKELREQMRDDLADQRELERDLKQYGGVDRGDRLAGWILRIGEACVEAKNLNGLLVTVEDAKADPDLLPPYDECREETCECEIDPVLVRDVPRGTRVAERAPDSGKSVAGSGGMKALQQQMAKPGHAKGTQRPKQRPKSGCLSVLLLVIASVVLLYVFAT